MTLKNQRNREKKDTLAKICELKTNFLREPQEFFSFKNNININTDFVPNTQYTIYI